VKGFQGVSFADVYPPKCSFIASLKHMAEIYKHSLRNSLGLLRLKKKKTKKGLYRDIRYLRFTSI